MSRTVLICHDLNLMRASILPRLRQFVGDGFASFNEGGGRNWPAPSVELSNYALEHPEHSVLFTRAARPIVRAHPLAEFRSVISVSHPVLRTFDWLNIVWEHRLRGEQRLFQNDIERNAGLLEFISEMVSTYRWPNRPQASDDMANFHVNALASKIAYIREPDAAVKLVQDLRNNSSFLLTDFPNTISPRLFGELINVGASIIGGFTSPIDAMSDLTASLARWRDRLPTSLFQRICGLNRADLAFFDEVGAIECDRLAASTQVRLRVRDVIDEVAEITGHRRSQLVQVSPAVPRGIMGEPDPMLGYRIQPSVSFDQTVNGVIVTTNIDETGHRVVPLQPLNGERTISAYGCSCTWGWSVGDHETFTGVLQSMLPTWRIENYGIPGYSQTPNLIELERNLMWQECDFVTFCWIEPHLFRNVADPSVIVRWLVHTILTPVQTLPRATFDEDGQIQFKQVAFKRFDLIDIDLSDFTPDAFYLDLICCGLLKRAANLVKERGGHFFVTILSNSMSPNLERLLKDAGVPVLNASLSGVEYQNLPSDAHPNALAHRLYAEQINDYVQRQVQSQTRAGKTAPV